MEKPDWKQYAQAALPLAISAGIVTATSALPHGAGNPAGLAALVASLGSNLAASGLAALCKPRQFRAGKEYQETLANHDIRRLIENAWGEAACATVQAYVEAYVEARAPGALSVVKVSPSPAFLETVKDMKPRDFVPQEKSRITVSTIRNAIAMTGRLLLPESATASPILDELRTALVESALDAIHNKLPLESKSDLSKSGLSKSDLPADFREFLDGKILGQLVIYAAFHLKIDHRAQVAVLHFTLQQISDRQVDFGEKLQEFCAGIYRSQSESQKRLLDSFDARIQRLSQELKNHIDQAFNRLVSPRLESPFDTPSDAREYRFSYRARATSLVGRESAMNALIEFMGDPRQGLWTVISGPAGTGKSRLAAELIAMVRDPAADSDGVAPGQWRAGFLRHSDSWLKHDAVKWIPDTDTLMVIDYAGELDPNLLSELLAGLGRSRELIPDCQVRIILIDRLPPDSEFGLARRLLSGNDRKTKISGNRWPTSGDPLALQPVAEASALEIVGDWTGRHRTVAAGDRVRQALQGDRELARPLFAALLGDAIGTDGLPPGGLNPVTVAGAALARLFRTHAEESHGPASRIKILLAASTAGQGVSVEDLVRNYPALSGSPVEPELPDAAKLELKRSLRTFAGTGSDGLVAPLEPDFLGGLFVLACLLRLGPPLDLQRVDLLMAVAWKHGRSPDAFVLRLASDFIGRGDQLAAAGDAYEGEHPDTGRVNEVLVRLILSGLSTEALPREGPRTIVYAVYLASKTGQTGIATRLMDALDAAYAKDPPEVDPGDLANAWFAFAISGDLPPSAQGSAGKALERIGQLRERHDTAEIAILQAQGLLNATVGEPDPRQREALAERIGQLRERHDNAEIALAQAEALHNAAVVEQDPRQKEALAERIGQLRERHDTAEIALAQAKALYNATVGEADLRQCEALSERIGQLRQRHDTAEIALEQAQALYNATVGEPDPRQCEALAERIGQLRERHDTAEIAILQAKALCNATVGEPDPRQREALAERIGQLRERHDTAEIARAQAQALLNATAVEPDARRRVALAERIGQLRQRHDTAEIALEQVQALFNATVGEPDPRQREVLAERIGQLRQRHDTAEIALFQARALFNATVVEPHPRQREALAERIGQLRQRHDTAEIALEQAKALCNATGGEPDPRQREALAERIGQLRERHDTAEIALAQAQALFNATGVEPEPQQREALAERIGQLRQRHDTAEIALEQAKALCNGTVGEPDPRQREALAERIGQLRERHDTAEIAILQAKALCNATVGEPDPRQREALAERIGQLRKRHDTAEIALAQAEALCNATGVEPDPRQREALAERIGQLRERHDTAEIALEQAKALFHATVGEPDPRQREALAERIGQLREQHDTAEIALEQAKALCNATVVEPDPRQREALAERIGQLRKRHDTAEIALVQAQALFNATGGEPDPRQREALAERIGQLRERHDTAEIALEQAKALCNATVVEPDPRQREALEARIRHLLASYGLTWDQMFE